MLSNDVREPTTSPWNFPLFLDGGYRPVVGYRRLNKLCRQERYPLPVLQDILMSTGPQNTVFGSLDLLSSYWQVPLTEDPKELTAFSTPSGHFCFKKMPFDISGAPLTFQRLINSIFSGLLGYPVFAFLDDIIVVSPDVESHFKKLEEFFLWLQEAGLTLKLSKCNFLKKQINFLGHKLDSEGVQRERERGLLWYWT